ncbi:YtxH domain-containing protein [Clostridium sp. B9]|uniref:YtxH domain-containing protein n=1 Tax=Clostridium sp. B9 TaxID=3423224 RepID=UPI003D2F3C49
MSLSRLIEEKRKAKARVERNKKAKVAVTGAAVGTLAGVLGGLLFAPKSGKETRNDIKEGSKKAVQKINDKTVELKDNLNTQVVKGKDNICEAKSKIKEYLASKKGTSNEEAVEENLLEAPVEVAEEAAATEEEVKENN